MPILSRSALAAAVVSLAACSRPAPAPPADAHADAHAGDHAGAHAHGDAPAGAGSAAPAGEAAADWCAPHGVPESMCTRCNPGLVARYVAAGDYCREHGLPESVCPQCHPEAAARAQAAAEDWCAEHAVPESMCTRCNPRLVARYVAAGDYCREHGLPESVCPLCHPERLPAGKARPAFPEPGLVVRLASPQTGEDAGIETRPARLQRVSSALEVVGQLDFDRNHLAQLSAPGEARVLEVAVDVGDEVRAGQPLVVLASASVGADQARLAAARARLEVAGAAAEREARLAEDGLSPRRAAEEARRELAAARADHDAARAALGAAGAAPGAGGRYVLRAPFAGTVVARDAVAGRAAGAGQVLVQVADLGTAWAELEVPEADAGRVRPGQPVRIELEGGRGAAREGRIARVAAAVDPASRTVRARVELANRDRALTAGAFLRARIQVSAEREALVVPRAAIQRAEGRTLVFVKRGEGKYEPVAVELGEVEGDRVEVTSGLAPGAEVVTTGAFLLKTEIMKESIGAGCCDLEERG